MSIIESFPTEILQEITQLLPTSLKNLRLTCKRFNDAIVPQMFSHITIDFNYKRPDDCKRFLESLVSRTHSSVLHAKSVTIDGMNSLFRGDKWLPLDVQMIVELLPLAIRVFVNANAVKWIIDKHSNGKGIASSVSELATLTSLELDIRIQMDYGDVIELEKLPPVQNLKIFTTDSEVTVATYSDVLITSDGPTPEMSNYLARSSNRLRDLTLDCRDSEPANPEPLIKILGPSPNITHLCLVGYFLQLNSTITPGLKSLISLTLKNAADPKTRVMRNLYLRGRRLLGEEPLGLDNTWNRLKDAKIFLKHITVDEISKGFIQYLESYINLLETLVIEDEIPIRRPHLDISVLALYNSHALGAHAASLQKLVISSLLFGEEWCFGDHNSRMLQTFINLKYLSMSVTYDLHRNVPDIDLYEKDSPLPPSFYNPVNSVNRLMEVAFTLYNLNVLSIRGARVECVHCHCGARHVWIPGVKIIESQVNSFGPLDPLKYKFTILNDTKRYMLQRLGDKEGFWYTYC